MKWPSSWKMAPSFSTALTHPLLTPMVSFCLNNCFHSHLTAISTSLFPSSPNPPPPPPPPLPLPQAGTLLLTCSTSTNQLERGSPTSLTLLAMSPMSGRSERRSGTSFSSSIHFIHSTLSWTCMLWGKVTVSNLCFCLSMQAKIQWNLPHGYLSKAAMLLLLTHCYGPD